MQYPPGTCFQVIKQKTSKLPSSVRKFFFDGAYQLRTIKKINNILQYTFSTNTTKTITISSNSCKEVDQFIAFCRNEPFKEQTVLED